MALHNRINGNRIDLIVTDGDRTLIDFKGSEYGSSWDLVGHLYCGKEQWQRIAKEFKDKIKKSKSHEEQEKIFLEWMLSDVGFFRGKDATPALTVPIPYTTGATEYFKEHTAGAKTAIISGGIDVIFERSRKDLGIDYCITNRLGIGADGRFDGTLRPEVTLHNKMQKLMQLKQKLGIDYANILIIGDSENDEIPMKFINLAGGISLAINPTSYEVGRAANFIITDFTQIRQYTEIS